MSTEAKTEQEKIIEPVTTAIKERLYNPVYSFILTSLVAANWQNILIIIKSNKDIYITLNSITSKTNFELYYFLLPVIVGVFLSIVMPYITSLVAGFTAKPNSKITHAAEISEAKILEEIAEKKIRANKKELESVKLKESTLEITHQAEKLEETKNNYYIWLKGLLEAYEELDYKIESDDDILKFITAIKNKNAIFDNEFVTSFKNLMYDIERYREKNGHSL